ncbi:MAG: hypothetical protein J6C50_00410 [Rickettsiales bacterium]|nr:hypothetical protein [Rickettsiales bacterium]
MYQIKSKSIEELQKIKKIINMIINLLENNITLIKDGQTEFDESQKELLKFLIGNKENVVSIISKLSNLLLKFNVLENEQNNSNNNFVLNDIDLEIIKTYLLEQREKK